MLAPTIFLNAKTSTETTAAWTLPEIIFAGFVLKTSRRGRQLAGERYGFGFPVRRVDSKRTGNMYQIWRGNEWENEQTQKKIFQRVLKTLALVPKKIIEKSLKFLGIDWKKKKIQRNIRKKGDKPHWNMHKNKKRRDMQIVFTVVVSEHPFPFRCF